MYEHTILYWGRQELKNMAHNGLWEHSAVTQIGWDGWVIPLRPFQLLEHMQCQKVDQLNEKLKDGSFLL